MRTPPVTVFANQRRLPTQPAEKLVVSAPRDRTRDLMRLVRLQRKALQLATLLLSDEIGQIGPDQVISHE